MTGETRRTSKADTSGRFPLSELTDALLTDLYDELDRLTAGEEPGWDPLVVPTPGQWIARWNSLGPAQRLARAQGVIETAEVANRCHFDGHRQRLEEDRQAQATVARMRELRDSWLLMTLEPGQVRRLLDGITRALDGQSATNAPQAEAAAVAGQPLTETQATAVRAAHLPRGTRITREVVDEAVRQMDADPHGLKAGMVVKPYTERGVQKWVFRCWGTDTCDGWLSLDHYSQESAERARDRHVAEEHLDTSVTEPGEALSWSALGTSGLLWLINRTVFHPRGLALTVHADGDTRAYGWSLARTPGGEPWQFDEETDTSGHERAEATLTAALADPEPLTDADGRTICTCTYGTPCGCGTSVHYMPQEQPMTTCTATIEGPHVLGGGPVHCTREAGHPENHVGQARDGDGKMLWTDHHAGAVPHGAPAPEEPTP